MRPSDLDHFLPFVSSHNHTLKVCDVYTADVPSKQHQGKDTMFFPENG